jgi:hypothetical protein
MLDREERIAGPDTMPAAQIGKSIRRSDVPKRYRTCTIRIGAQALVKAKKKSRKIKQGRGRQ